MQEKKGIIMKKKQNNQATVASETLTLTNHLLECAIDAKGRSQATAKIFNDLCKLLKKQNNSPKDMIDDIRYLIADYLENTSTDSYTFQEG